MSKEWIFSDDFKIKFSDKLFNEFMSTDNFKWTDEIVKEYGEWFKQKSDVFSSNPLYLVEQFKELKASKQQSVFNDKDWEIVLWNYDGRIYEDKQYISGLTGAEIHSVKRLSDNEVFSVGDNHSGSSYSNRVVKGFIIKNDEMFIIQYGGNTKLKDAKKVKQPLFTTHDGVAVYEGDRYWFIRFDDTIGEGNTDSFPLAFGKATFSTEEAANEYILMNKPCLSVQDLKNTFNSHHFGEGEYQLERLKKLAQSKLKQ